MKKIKLAIIVLSCLLLCSCGQTMEDMELNIENKEDIQNIFENSDNSNNIEEIVEENENDIKLQNYGASGELGVPNPNILNSLEGIEINLEYSTWISKNNFKKNGQSSYCEDETILWALSLINDKIDGGIFNFGEVLDKEQVGTRLNLNTSLFEDFCAIIDEENFRIFFMAKVIGSDREEKMKEISASLLDYKINLYNLYAIDENSLAKLSCFAIAHAGPYIYMVLDVEDEENTNQDFNTLLEIYSEKNEEIISCIKSVLIYQYNVALNEFYQGSYDGHKIVDENGNAYSFEW